MKQMFVVAMFVTVLAACTGGSTGPEQAPKQAATTAASAPDKPKLNRHQELAIEMDMASHEVDLLYLKTRTAVLKGDIVPLIGAIPENESAAQKRYMPFIRDADIEPEITAALKQVYAAHLNFIQNAAPSTGERASGHEYRLAAMRADFDLAMATLQMELDLKYPLPSPPAKADAVMPAGPEKQTGP